jgi:hypothetical protein
MMIPNSNECDDLSFAIHVINIYGLCKSSIFCRVMEDGDVVCCCKAIECMFGSQSLLSIGRRLVPKERKVTESINNNRGDVRAVIGRS